jgi:hypothetical protein
MNERDSTLQIEHEKNFVNAFVLPKKRDRWNQMLISKRRWVILERLAGWDDFMPERMKQISKTISTAQIIQIVSQELNTTHKSCWIISMCERLDKQALSLSDSLTNVAGVGLGTVVSIVPGVLAFYESELGHRFLLRS